MSFNTITVSPGVELAYTDTGAPKASPYTTIFAIHGMCFTNLIYEKLQSVALAKGFRFVAINRRPFAGSTPFNAEEINLIVNVVDSAEKRAAFIEARGHEYGTFIDIFTQRFGLPPVSNDGKIGGSIVLGWSMGSQFAAATLAYAPTLPSDVRSRLSQHIRALVVYDAAPIIFGLPTPEKNWAPLVDTTVPENLRLPMFGQWVTGYFDNGDYSKRDLDTLAYVLPSTDKVPSMFSHQDLGHTTTYGQEAGLDLPLLFFFPEQLKATFRKAFGGSETAALFPELKTTFVCADRSPSFALAGLWAAQDDLKEAGLGDGIKYKVVNGANHFLHWENPEKALEIFISDV